MRKKMIFIIILAVVAALIVSLFLFINLAPQFGGKASVDQRARYEKSVNFRNGIFQNYVETPVNNPDVPMTKAMREYFSGGRDRVPNVKIPIHKIERGLFTEKNADKVTVTWLGHSSVLFQFEGFTFLTDPMFGKRASPVSFMGPKRFDMNLPLEPETVPHLDAIILSHDHYDHLDYKTIKALHPKTDRFFVPLGVAPHLLKWGVDENKIVELDWWENAEVDGIEFIATPARHFSGRRGNDRGKTLWASWVIISDKHRIYFGGDSGYGNHFGDIGKKCGPFDVTLLENGAYNEAWPYVHMMPEQTAQAHLDLKGDFLLPIHWAQFNLSLHPWREPIERLAKAADEMGIKLATPMIGQSFTIGGKVPNSKWWTKEYE
jgi:L-ascorbate metabolism protein UlaG (beta-lactamase superfamily)